MAEKKQSQAEKAATANKSKTTKKNTPTVRKGGKVEKAVEQQTKIPVRLITSAVALGLFVVFLIAFLNPEGIVVEWFLELITSIFGKIAFYVAIPALLYLFVIQAFSGKRPVIFRSPRDLPIPRILYLGSPIQNRPPP